MEPNDSLNVTQNDGEIMKREIDMLQVDQQANDEAENDGQEVLADASEIEEKSTLFSKRNGSIGDGDHDHHDNDVNDEENHEEHVDNTALIKEGTQQVLRSAIGMERSDSILSISASEEGSATSENFPHPTPHKRSESVRYMEDASFEVSHISPDHHRLAPSGAHGRQHTSSFRDIIDLRLNINEDSSEESHNDDDSSTSFLAGIERRQSERGVFEGVSKLGMNEQGHIYNDPPPLDTIYSGTDKSGDDEEDDTPTTSDPPPPPAGDRLFKILESCGLDGLPQAPARYSKDVVLLHSIFQDFCIPPLDLESVERVLEMEKGEDTRSIYLPMDVVIHKPSTVLINLLGPPLRHVPRVFSLGFFRLLIRLLTNENDEDYNRETLRTCGWYDETFNPGPMSLATMLTRQRTNSTSSLKKQSSFSEKSFNRGSAARKADQMYTMVRLQRNWGGAVLQVYNLLETLVEDPSREFLLAPVIRLLGLLCTGGVTVYELRHMVALTVRVTTTPKAQLLLVRALNVAAEGASKSSLLVGKASPRHFFSFGYGPGMSRNISLRQLPWPFKNDFGMALWFRAERFCDSSALLRSVNEIGNGIEVSLIPVKNKSTGDTAATVLAVSILEAEKVVHCIKVNSCVLLPRVWYHVGLRHTRSRLKGVFSLASREQVSIMLDGKVMLTEPLKFPQFRDSPDSSLSLTLGGNFDGQTGGLYIFHDNVSDATFRALYEVTAGTSGVIQRRASANDDWDSRRGDIARKSNKYLDLSMRKDDMDDIVLSQRTPGKESVRSGTVIDLEDEVEGLENNPLSKAAFNSRLYLVWDPMRTEGNVALELHSGAHVRLDSDNVQAWSIEGAQDVISSIGGVQALLPIFRCLLNGDIEKRWKHSMDENEGDSDGNSLFDESILCSLVPDLLSLLASFLRDHSENAREMLRCGGIDIVEQLLLSNKKIGAGTQRKPASSLVGSLSIFPALSNRLMDSLLALRSACAHYIGLETRVFSRLLFNLPLWLGGPSRGVSLYRYLLPVLSSITRTNAEKVRDCSGTKDMTYLLKELVENKENRTLGKEESLFSRDTGKIAGLNTPLTILERRHAMDILLAMMLEVLGSGLTIDSLPQLLYLVSTYLEAEWGEASKEAANGITCPQRTGVREERYLFTVKACTLLLFLLQIQPSIPNLYECFADCCGSVAGGASWILSAMINSYCDRIRSIGVRCLVAYLERTAKSPDAPLSLERPIARDSDKTKNLESLSLPGNTLSLISNVGQGILMSNVGRGLAAIGPSVRAAVLSPSKLTSGVVYKLLWHLLKSHRYRLGKNTQSSLIRMVFHDGQPSSVSFDSLIFLKENFIKADTVLGEGVKIDMAWANTLLTDTSIGPMSSIRESLGIGTVMRLLRYLPGEFTDQWLSILVQVTSTSQSAVGKLSSCADWQPCLFQLISEVIEPMTSVSSSPKSTETCSDDALLTKDNTDESSQENGRDNREDPQLGERFDLAVDLYANLLGHCIREDGEKALQAIEDAASLQRVCLNGPEVFSLVLSRLLSNLSEYGVIPLEGSAPQTQGATDEPSELLKRSARLVTDAILSNGTVGLKMPEAVARWRCLRHLTAVTVAVVAKCGFGVAELFDYRDQSGSAVDRVSEGLNGIRLPDGVIAGIRHKDLVLFYETLDRSSNGRSEAGIDTKDSKIERTILRRISVALSAQLLSLLDVFIFPDSLDASLPASQLHGLALVRSTETRIGSSQGPLLASAIRLSLVLLCHLEPCSVKLLQCSSRLRCFLHWALELIRESEALDGYSAAFNDLSAPLDRLILAIVIQCHRALGRCGALLSEIESSSFDKYFESKESQKKYYRRLLRVALELRDIILTAYKGRNEVLQTALLPRAFQSLQACLEVPATKTDEQLSSKPASQKELIVRILLNSGWVTQFQDVDIRGNQAFPEQVEQGNGKQDNASASCGVQAVELLSQESKAIVLNFENALNVCFEHYLEAQRRWAETGAVRDLEYVGDTTLKRLSTRHRVDMGGSTKLMSLRSAAAENRWSGIDRKIIEVWDSGKHWKVARYADSLGRRILLVPNRAFDDHSQASYELLMGREREKEERDREERLRKKQELSDLMKRNSEAFVPYGVADNEDVDDENLDKDDGDAESETDVGDNAGESASDSGSEVDESEGLDEKKVAEADGEITSDVDAWAKTFIWSDNESVVARFESVMVVTLIYTVTGKLLLTTHGLYFHQSEDVINVMTRESQLKSEPSLNSMLDANDRRWRLSRLTEVLGRRYMLRGQALEMFFADSHALFLNFLGGSKERDRFYAKVRNSCKVPMLFSPKLLHPRTVFKKSKYTELWRKRKITNFEYLMALNKMAGRTFNDISQYPVFPWILADYSSETINLSDSRVYRDLTKPIGALSPDRLAQLLERYNELEQFGFSESEKFLYGSHYSSPGVILHYLIRQEPFTSMAIDLQSGRFDCPDRLFFDLSESWKGCNTSSSDVKELIPEFFTLPEMLLNTNRFPLGHTQKGHPVDNVGLPPWAKGSAHEFVRIHRLALESEYVSQNLNRWIDLIFGYQQRGPEAEKAHNVFHHLSYEGSVDLDKITDELDRNAAESHIQNFGQTPSQLLVKEPHPSRYPSEDCWRPLINDMIAPTRLRCHTPSRQYGGKKNGPGAVTKIHIQADSVVVVYADLSIGVYKWSPKNGTSGLKPDKLRPLPNREVSNSRAALKRGAAAPQTMDDSKSSLAVGNWSCAVTLGGYEKEQQRRKAVMPSRLASAKDALYTEASPVIVSCGFWDNTVKVHAMDNWRLECSESGGHRGPIRCLAIGEDGGLLVTGGQDCTCRIWVVDHPDMAIALSDGYVQTALGQSTDGDQILSCCHVLWGHQTAITCLAISSDLDAVVSGSMEGKVCLHTIRRGEFVRSILPPSVARSPVSKLAVDSHGRLIAHMGDCGLHSYTVNGFRHCSIDAGEKLHDMKITGEVVVTGGDRCRMYIRDIQDLQVLSMLDLSRHGPIRCIAMTPVELNPIPQFLFIGSDDGMITIVDKDEEKKV